MQKCLFCGCKNNISHVEHLLCKKHKSEMKDLKKNNISIFYCPFCLLEYTKTGKTIPKYYRSNQTEMFKEDPDNDEFNIYECDKCKHSFYSRKEENDKK